MGLLQALGLPEITAPTATSAVAPTVGSSAGSTPAGAAQKSAFAAARVAASALIDALKAHPQTASIQVLITQAGAKLAIADAHAAKSEWPQAMQALEDVKAIAATAKKAADDRQGFTIKLADITSGMNAFQNFGGNSTFTLLSNASGTATARKPAPASIRPQIRTCSPSATAAPSLKKLCGTRNDRPPITAGPTRCSSTSPWVAGLLNAQRTLTSGQPTKPASAACMAGKSMPSDVAQSENPSSIQRTKLAWNTIRAGSHSFQCTVKWRENAGNTDPFNNEYRLGLKHSAP